MNSKNTNSSQSEYGDKKRVTLVGAAVNLVLAGLKIAIGTIGNSHALVADGLHSLSDLASDAMVLVAAKAKSKGADEALPYGYARFETLATIGLSMLLLAVAVGIIIDSVDRLMEPANLIVPSVIALGVAVASILSKEWLYHYTMRVAKRVRSDLLKANAWHHRSDAISSIVVLVGIAGAMAGLPWLDAVAAIGVALMIGRIGVNLGWSSLMELVDSGVDPETLNTIKKIIESVDGVEEFHMLRTRRMGSEVLVEVHVLVDPSLSVSEGHMIGDRVLARLKREHPDIGDVLVHIDPEDDTLVEKHVELPGRSEIIEKLKAGWEPVAATRQIEKINLHYLDGRIDVEVVLPISVATGLPESQSIAQAITASSEAQDFIGKTSVLFRSDDMTGRQQKLAS